MTKHGIVFLFACVLAAIWSADAQNLELPKLPYDYNALEPVIDEATMRVHHLGHHVAYLNTINSALTALRANDATKHLAKMGIDKLLQHLSEVPAELAAPVRNGGGGFVNHVLFWTSMTPGGKKLPESGSPLRAKVDEDFGSWMKMQDLFSDKALKHFGSGWAWLVLNLNGTVPRLEVTTTANQDTPAMHPDVIPILGLDVWEHAYYLNYKNKRADYIEAWWNVVDWPAVEDRFQDALAAPKEEL